MILCSTCDDMTIICDFCTHCEECDRDYIEELFWCKLHSKGVDATDYCSDFQCIDANDDVGEDESMWFMENYRTWINKFQPNIEELTKGSNIPMDKLANIIFNSSTSEEMQMYLASLVSKDVSYFCKPIKEFKDSL